MKLKQVPEDFRVNEIYDLNTFKDRDENRPKPYFYFKLTKTNYAQLRAMDVIARTLNTSKKLVHFAGTKDKVGVTTQLISVYGINEENLEANLNHLHETFPEIKLDLIGEYKGRINLSDNLGNAFEIIVRDLEENEILKAQGNIDKLNKEGVLNYFDEQRFGYANNSHIVGKYIMQNEVKKAVYEIMTSLPKNTQSEILTDFVNFIEENFEEISNQNIDIIDQAIEITPRYLQNEKMMLEHLKVHKNDFPGAFRKIHKKLRMLYVNAYQSYVFNETIKELNKKNILDDYKELSLVCYDIEFDDLVQNIVDDLLAKDDLCKENFVIKHMPELRISSVERSTKNFPKNIEIRDIDEDDLNDGKKKCVVTFELGSGEYATNVVKQLFE